MNKQNFYKQSKSKIKNMEPTLDENQEPGKNGNPVEHSMIKAPEKPSEQLPFLERLNKYSNLIVGAATVLLVFVTAIYIILSWKIANETKRLADITVEQFKIKSFPSFLIIRSNPAIVDGRFKDEIMIHNRGEISSYETSFLMFYGVLTQEGNQPKELSFLSDYMYVYRDKDLEDIDIFDYSKKILPNSGSIIGIDKPMPDEIINNLKYHLIIIRHKVPYDSTFSYETHAFGIERKQQDSNMNNLHWETLPDSKKNALFERLLSQIS